MTIHFTKSQQIFYGRAAIEAARADDRVMLCKFADPEGGEEHDLSPTAAHEILRIDESLIYGVK